MQAHVLTMVPGASCEFCGQPGSRLKIVHTHVCHMGWRSCADPMCLSKAEESYRLYTKPREEISSRWPSLVVKRTSGVMERGWEPFCDAFLSNDTWSVIVISGDGCYVKSVPMACLEAWNTHPDDVAGDFAIASRIASPL